ncbi:unnamed protein product [Peronospora belbahrii]|uniref:Uncharacterized protein n=1 Tax=Peronospora belbahrii TaxID=622444 RepID=A0ABN8DE30_9STRA|nr:unnamed protein product [Peronospora belbahrii]
MRGTECTSMQRTQARSVIAGPPPGGARNSTQNITLHQGTDDMHWRCTGPILDLADRSFVEQRASSGTEGTRSRLRRAPTASQVSVGDPDTIPNSSVQAPLIRPTLRYHTTVLARPLGNFLDRLEERAGHDEWQRAAHGQTPKQAWNHCQGLTTVQVWTGIGSQRGNSICTMRGEWRTTPAKATRLSRMSRDNDALVLDCPFAFVEWTKLVGHWKADESSAYPSTDNPSSQTVSGGCGSGGMGVEANGLCSSDSMHRITEHKPRGHQA